MRMAAISSCRQTVGRAEVVRAEDQEADRHRDEFQLRPTEEVSEHPGIKLNDALGLASVAAIYGRSEGQQRIA